MNIKNTNTEKIRSLEPVELWNYFVDLNAVPRPSKKEEKVRKFVIDFAKSQNLEVEEDSTGNILIKKRAYPGYEGRKKIVLQAHLDMVCQKNNEVIFDFESEGIKMVKDNDWIKAEGTTLGADNGIGVAAIMAVLASYSIEHPPIEALFTVDEETGMTGALGLEFGFLSGDILLNLDTEEDHEISVGCAGGIDITAWAQFEERNVAEEYHTFLLELKGLHGGHSGMDIHKGFGNANKLINRFLYDFLEYKLLLTSFNGGGVRNAIPGEAVVIFSVLSVDKEKIKMQFQKIKEEIISEFRTLEQGVVITLSDIKKSEKSLSFEEGKKVIMAIQAVQNGVFRMSTDIGGGVETSNNVAQVILADGNLKISCLTRSSIESAKYWNVTTVKSAFEFAGMKVELSGSYPGWKPDLNSEIVKIVIDIYERQNGQKPLILAGHGGLECGIIGEKYPNMEMISFGPTIKGAHSSQEKVSILSVQKFWGYFLEILKNIPSR